MSTALNRDQLNTALTTLSHWTGNSAGISRTFTFVNFPAAIQFMSAMVADIETLNHHPEWRNIYNRLEVTLRTHDADNQVTDLDIQLAQTLDEHFSTAEASASI